MPAKRVDVMAIQRGKGRVPLQMLEGREPVGSREIALGTTTLRELGKRIGDTLAAEFATGPSLQLRIVGSMALSAGPQDPAIAPGSGAVVDAEVLERGGVELSPPVFLVRLDPTADRRQALDALQVSFPGANVEQVLDPDIKNLS